MANWMTVTELSARYLVGEHKLFEYARRGNMPMFRRPDGITLFDEAHAAQLFRPRHGAAMVAAPATGKPNMGVLGASFLGENAEQRKIAPAPIGPDPILLRSRRPVLRFIAQDELPEIRQRKATG